MLLRIRNRTLLAVALLLLLKLRERLVAAADRSTSIRFPRERVRANPAYKVETSSRAEGTTPPTSSSRTSEIPLEFLLQLSDVRNVTYFMNNFVDTDSFTEYIPADSVFTLENRFGAENERKSVHSAKPALCEPQLEVVPLVKSRDPSLFYYPTCTRIERCGGCCGSPLLECQPLETELVNYKVLVTQYTGAKQMKFKGHEVATLERHLECKCDCIKKETDCNKFQEYRPNECQCICINNDEKEKCIMNGDSKVWDTSTCTCNCRYRRNCSSGYYFDEEDCRCTPVPVHYR